MHEGAGQEYVAAFEKAYPEVIAYLALLRLRVAITGQTWTWAGRPRTVSAHRWMVTAASASAADVSRSQPLLVRGRAAASFDAIHHLLLSANLVRC